MEKRDEIPSRRELALSKAKGDKLTSGLAMAQRFRQYPTKHIIHKAIEWQGMLDERLAESLNDIAKIENLSRARVTQIMDLLKLPAEAKELLTGLQDSGEIRRYSERRLRNNQTSKIMRKA